MNYLHALMQRCKIKPTLIASTQYSFNNHFVNEVNKVTLYIFCYFNKTYKQ